MWCVIIVTAHAASGSVRFVQPRYVAVGAVAGNWAIRTSWTVFLISGSTPPGTSVAAISNVRRIRIF